MQRGQRQNRRKGERLVEAHECLKASMRISMRIKANNIVLLSSCLGGFLKDLYSLSWASGTRAVTNRSAYNYEKDTLLLND